MSKKQSCNHEFSFLPNKVKGEMKVGNEALWYCFKCDFIFGGILNEVHILKMGEINELRPD